MALKDTWTTIAAWAYKSVVTSAKLQALTNNVELLRAFLENPTTGNPLVVKTINSVAPSSTGNIAITLGATAQALTTSQRTALSSPTVGTLVYDTDQARLYVYGNSGWAPTGSCQIDVFTASGTWTMPAGAKIVTVILISSGCGGGSNNGPGGGKLIETLPASLLPSSASITIPAGGTGATSTNGNPGGSTTFGSLLAVTGGGALDIAFGGAPAGAARTKMYNTLASVPTPFMGGCTDVPASSHAAGAGQGAAGALAAGTDATSSANAGAGQSRSGTGLAGSGGGAGYNTSTAVCQGGSGGIPGGGGGRTGNTSYYPGGAGARGEAIIITQF